MKAPKMSDRLVVTDGIFIVAMLVIQFAHIPSLAIRMALALVALISLAVMIVLIIKEHWLDKR